MNRQGAADLVIFGPCRLRAWVVIQGPSGCSLGYREEPFGGQPEAVWKSCLGAFWGLFWASWACFGGLWGPLGASWGFPGGLLGRNA
eukprot:4077261-Pyramimonas_sp.AAC.1